MLTCIPCPNAKGLLKEITNQIKGMSLKAVGVQRRRRKKAPQHSKEAAVVMEGKEEKEDEEEWVTEPEPGVLITLVGLANGANRLKKIRFSEELFDAWGAQRWWADNHNKVMELYSIHQEPPQSDDDDECPVDSVEGHKSNGSPVTSHANSSASTNEHEANHSTNATTGEGSEGGSTESEVVETVVEDEPGIFVTIRSLPDGSKELLRVELSRERFGEVKARVWWEENKARLHKQYS